MKDVCVLCGRTGHASKDCPMGKRIVVILAMRKAMRGPLLYVQSPDV